MSRTLLCLYLFSGYLFFLSGCSSDDERICGLENIRSIKSGICLVFENEDAFGTLKGKIESIVDETVTEVNAIMPINDVEIRISINANQVIPEIGIGGYNPNEKEVIIYLDPNFNNLGKSLDTELGPIVAHELHHANRRRSVGYGATLHSAAVSEGMADWFSMEVTGIDPPIWSVAIQGGTLDYWIEQASEVWTEEAYDHSLWFFGSTDQVPRWAGYSIGFELVKDFIAKNPGRKASDLFDEPAESFLP